MQASPAIAPAVAPAAQPAQQVYRAGQAGNVVGTAGPAEIYQALRQQRRELSNQLETLEDRRQDLTRQLQQQQDNAGTPGIAARIKEVDARISAVEAQLAQADAAVAQAAAIPGAVVEPKPIPRSGPSEEVMVMTFVLLMSVVVPITIAYARRIWRRGATIIAPVPKEVQERLDGLAHAVESIGLEVERIGEGQRFMTKLFAEQRQPHRLEGER